MHRANAPAISNEWQRDRISKKEQTDGVGGMSERFSREWSLFDALCGIELTHRHFNIPTVAFLVVKKCKIHFIVLTENFTATKRVGAEIEKKPALQMLKWKRKTNIVFSARIETFSIRYSISHLNDFEFFGVKAHCLVHFQLQYSPFLSLPLSFFLPPMISHSATNLAYRYYFIRTNCASAKYFFPAVRNIRTRKMKPSEYLSSMHSSKLSTMDYFSSITITWWHLNDKVSKSKTHSLLFQPVENCAFLWFDALCSDFAVIEFLSTIWHT